MLIACVFIYNPEHPFRQKPVQTGRMGRMVLLKRDFILKTHSAKHFPCVYAKARKRRNVIKFDLILPI
ncbi:hypothetical protein MCC93_15620 [Morococcus cerebrosus]|uniref:Uncharacterized protein n=2 Tax=Neisseriaceae TaxID=481 RepID=A0A0C1GKL4_9NEIS|nr:hypothetical protein MCC93_15620 [Morococcus cerebrosus]